MNREFRPNADFHPWGPFVSKNFKNETITLTDITIATIVWAATLVCIAVAIRLGYQQTKASRFPLRSTYVWLVWLELLASFLMGLECYFHLLKFIKPSFIYYCSILLWWCIQVQLLLQIIINRIRVIVPDRQRSKYIMIGTATIVTAINISVFNIWIPARLQVGERYRHINEIWDRIEKVIYLFMDAGLNWYFLKTVKQNLINNGLQKYNKLLRYNQRIIAVSLLMDVMIIAAMSIPNSFVYIQFHPLAYLVKLNIEMTMANLIKRIAVSTSKRTGNAAIIEEFNSSSNKSSTGHRSQSHHHRRSSFIELTATAFSGNGTKNKDRESRDSRVNSFLPTGSQIKKTEEITIRSDPRPTIQFEDDGKSGTLTVAQRDLGLGGSKSLDDVTEGAESVKSEEAQRREDSSDDEVRLVKQQRGGWAR
ncbi:hypothetical protein BCR34DRAFT_74186 [Clohesyomyces aquaticus]|uniref:Integral membrane protein n=1 Tax=Clohesyomyces aquaticus TaxID=1231657 RepID=A0A1Y2A319_9PLEO|nr:hypothetical protein BCR34DRAFT_74186 [Clohesyomyces aquaticus]